MHCTHTPTLTNTSRMMHSITQEGSIKTLPTEGEKIKKLKIKIIIKKKKEESFCTKYFYVLYFKSAVVIPHTDQHKQIVMM